VSIVDDLINDLVNQHKILPDRLLIQYSTEVSEYLHHPVEDIQDIGGRNVVFSSRYEEYSKFLGIEIVDSINILYKLVIWADGSYKTWRGITLPEFDLSEEYFTGFSSKIKADYILNRSIMLSYSL
jgi:hypothetical protein